jgi:hypothetical protein
VPSSPIWIDSANTSQPPNEEIFIDKSLLLPNNPARQKYRCTSVVCTNIGDLYQYRRQNAEEVKIYAFWQIFKKKYRLSGVLNENSINYLLGPGENNSDIGLENPRKSRSLKK